MFNAIANMIIKAADNINRGVENASEAGEGNNGQTYQSNVGKGLNDTTKKVAETVSENKTEKSDDTKTEEAPAQQSKPAEVKGPGSNGINPSIGGGLDIGGGLGGSEEQTQDVSQEVSSDERLKRIFGENAPIDCFAKINAIQFEYNDKAKEIHPDGENGVDNDPHLGVKAQDLADNPMTASTVSKDADGYLQVNPSELTMANTAVISEICKHLKVIEKILGVKVD